MPDRENPTDMRRGSTSNAPLSANTRSLSWKGIVAMLAAGWIVIWVSRTMLTPIYPILSDFFGGISNAQLGAISSSYFLGYVIIQIPSGMLSDKIGIKRVIVPGFILFSLGCAVMCASSSLLTMYAGSFMAGVGSGTFYGIAYTLTTLYVPMRWRSVATAVVNGGTAIGSAVGLISASSLVSTGMLPWQAIAFATAVAGAVMVAVFARFVPGKEASRSADAATETPSSASNSVANVPASNKGLFSTQLIAIYIVYFSSLYGYYLISTWLPDFLASERAFSNDITGMVSSLVFIAAIPGSLLFSRIADRLPNRMRALIIGLQLLAAAMLALIACAPEQGAILFGIVAYGFFGKLAVEPILISRLGSLAPAGRLSTALGVFNFFGMSASVIAPTATGVLSDILGSGAWGILLACLIIVLGTAWFIMTGRSGPDAS